MIFPRRRSRRTDPHLSGKIQIFFLGAGLALGGIALDSPTLVGVAIVILAMGLLLGLLPGRSRKEGEEPSSGDTHHEESR
jgi:hypothetical protein